MEPTRPNNGREQMAETSARVDSTRKGEEAKQKVGWVNGICDATARERIRRRTVDEIAGIATGCRKTPMMSIT
jgi:hypothetical protein